ncbi:MAG: TraR/DksA C4-type zinc finger protein [Thermodesulfobacteriota bacterium]|nr:TraR/DksA C4-type zinc finger protein [Thermodesulfobacteriota bacterium]
MANAVPSKSKKKTASTSKTKSNSKPKAKLVKQTKAEEQFNTTCSKKKLSAKFKREIKTILIGMKEEILADITKIIKSESDHLKYDVGDFYDSASNDRERDLLLSLNQRDRQKLIMIEDAIKRIDNGTYGKCPYGNEVIDEERLRAMPFTRYCVSCIEEDEEFINSDF